MLCAVFVLLVGYYYSPPFFVCVCLFVNAMHCLGTVFFRRLVLCAVFLFCLFARLCYALSLCCVCWYVSALSRLSVVFVC